MPDTIPPSITDRLSDEDRSALSGLTPADALDVLFRLDGTEPSSSRKVALRDLRVLAGLVVRDAPGDDEVGTPAAADHGAELPRTADGIPYVERGDLTLGALTQALHTTGCLLYKGLVAPDRAAQMREALDTTLEAIADQDHTADEHLCTPPKFGGRGVEPMGRVWTRREGGSLTVDAPWLLAALLDDYRAAGVLSVAEEFVRERPALAAEKCFVRKFPGKGLLENGWHQDGAFIGTPRVLNAWVTFSDCGRQAPGMELLLKRVDEIYETDGRSDFAWSLSDPQVRELATRPGEIVVPEFEAGDALLFDHWFVHRTSRLPESYLDRYSAEAWFFAPSTMREDYTPILV